jgi:hypothetical protein
MTFRFTENMAIQQFGILIKKQNTVALYYVEETHLRKS